MNKHHDNWEEKEDAALICGGEGKEDVFPSRTIGRLKNTSLGDSSSKRTLRRCALSVEQAPPSERRVRSTRDRETIGCDARMGAFYHLMRRNRCRFYASTNSCCSLVIRRNSWFVCMAKQLVSLHGKTVGFSCETAGFLWIAKPLISRAEQIVSIKH